MSDEPLMFRSGKKNRINWRLLAIFAAFFVIAGAVKIFGLTNITGFTLAESAWSEEETTEPIEQTYQNTWQNYTPWTYTSNYSNKRQPVVYGGGSSGIVGTVPGIKPIQKPPTSPPPPLFYENSTPTLVGVYYNRTMPRSDSYQLVPVPNARIITNPAIENYTSKLTNASGLTNLIHPNKTTTVTVIAPGFLINKHAIKTITNESSVHFFLTISKSKVSMQSHDKFVMGRNSNTTISILTTFPDTVSEQNKFVENTVLDVAFIKEVNEKIIYLSEHSLQEINLTEGTQTFSLNLAVPNNLYARDLYLPRLHLKLLTSTGDIIHEKKEKISIGFLEATLNSSIITITNPTGRPLKSILISSEITNEKGDPLVLNFSENNFNLPAFSSKNITFQAQNGAGACSGTMVVSGTLPPVDGWDEPGADTVFLPYSKHFPVHDVAIYTKTAPILSGADTKIEVLLENKENFLENVNISLQNDLFLWSENLTLTPFESKYHQISLNSSNLSSGVANFELKAQISDDFRPADNQQNISFFITKNASPQNIVLLIFDGLGELHLNNELTPNIMGYMHRGFTSTNMKVRIPSTTESHSVLFTSQYNKTYDWRAYSNSVSLPNNSLFDSARSKNYTVLGVMGQGDAEGVVGKMDAILHDPHWSDWEQFNSSLTINKNISQELQTTFENHNNLSAYKGRSNSIFVDYDWWTADALSGVLNTLSNTSEKFLLVSNFAGTDHGGHSGPSDYAETLEAVDLQAQQVLDTLMKTGIIENTILIITADHGMCFREGSYGEYGYHASCSLPEAMRIPFIVLGPGISPKFSDSLAFNDAVTPTLEHLFNLPKQNTTGRILTEMFSDIEDVGIISSTTTPLVPGSFSTTSILLENYGQTETTPTICFNNDCATTTIQPHQQNPLDFLWKPEDSGIYSINPKIQESDDNLQNNQLIETKFCGIVNDLAVDTIYYSLTNDFYNNETKKILIDIDLCNHGTLAFDDNVKLRIWTENCNESWCNKTYNPKFSASSGNCNKYKNDAPFGLKSGLQTIHFQIQNSTDMLLANDYRQFTTFLP